MDFTSVTLAGSLRQTIFKRANTGQSMPEFSYLSGSGEPLEERGTAQLESVGSCEISAGDVYRLGRSSLHRIDGVAPQGSVSLVLTTGRKKKARVPVFRFRNRETLVGIASELTINSLISLLNLD
jgi:hypothetical protein